MDRSYSVRICCCNVRYHGPISTVIYHRRLAETWYADHSGQLWHHAGDGYTPEPEELKQWCDACHCSPNIEKRANFVCGLLDRTSLFDLSCQSLPRMWTRSASPRVFSSRVPASPRLGSVAGWNDSQLRNQNRLFGWEYVGLTTHVWRGRRGSPATLV